MRTKLFLSLTLLSLLAAAQGRAQEREASVDAARKEGIVSWYSTLAVSESQPLATKSLPCNWDASPPGAI